MENSHITKLIKRHKTKSIFIGAITAIILTGLLLFGHSVAYANKILPKISIGGVEVGGLSREEAREKIQKKIFSISNIKYQRDEKSWDFKLADISAKYNLDKSVSSVYNLGKTGSIWSRLGDQIISLFSDQDKPLVYTFDESKFIEAVNNNIASQIEDQQLETKIEFDGIEPKIVEGKVGQRIDRDLLISQTKDWISFPVKNKKIGIDLKKSQPLVSAENAKIALNNAKTIVSADLKLITPKKEFILGRQLIASWVLSKVVGQDGNNSKNRSYILAANLDNNKVASFIEAIKKEVDTEAANARVIMDNGKIKVLSESQTGLDLKKDESVKVVSDMLLARNARKNSTTNLEINLVVNKVEPDVKASEVVSLGIKELIGKAATNILGSSVNRLHNITVGANLLSGSILKDGEEFSALNHLGAVEASQGFVPEKVIKAGKITTELGGGLCQNATTLFRAAIDAGLPIMERQNHGRRVSYYEMPISVKGINITFDYSKANIGNSLVGYDSTIFIPQPDLKFKNNTGKAILVQEYVVGRVVYAEIYGTKDGRVPSISKAEVISIIPAPATIYHDAPDLPKGTNEQVIRAVSGARTKFTYTVKYADGHQDSQIFSSYYKAIAPEVKVGSGVPPPGP